MQIVKIVKIWLNPLSVSLNIVNFRTEISSFREIVTEDQNINGVDFQKFGNSKDLKWEKMKSKRFCFTFLKHFLREN